MHLTRCEKMLSKTSKQKDDMDHGDLGERSNGLAHQCKPILGSAHQARPGFNPTCQRRCPSTSLTDWTL